MPLSTTKLNRPPLASDYVARSRLLDHLERWRERPLTLVSTPAGYGKSTLLSAWLQEMEAASGWLSLETRDDSLHALASGMVQAFEGIAQQSLPRIGSRLKAPDLPDPESLARQLVEEIEEADTPLILVLDDYHFIRDREAHDFVGALIESRSGTLRLAIATRMDPPLPLARFRAGGQITEIRQDDLSFTDDEAGEFLTKALEREVESEVARKLNEKTEGWPAGLRLGALTLQRAEDPEAFLDQLPTGGRFVTDYLLTEVLSQQTPVMQEYLLRTSVVDRFCPELCDALFEVDLGHPVEAGVVDGVAFIKLVARANVFLIPLDDAGQWFRYHHLFGDLLRHQLKGRNTAGQIRKLHERGSAWLEGQGFLEDAIEQAFHADLELTTELLSGHRHDIMNAEKWYELGQWLKRIPEEYIDGSPELLLLLAWTMEHFQHLEKMIDLTHRAGALLQGADDVDSRSLMGEVESLLSFESYFIALDGRGAIEHLETSLNLLDPEADCARGFTVVMLALSYQMVGDMEGARRIVREHMRPGAGPPGTFDGRLVTALLVADWIAGDLHRLSVDAGEGCRIGREGQLSETLGLAMYFRTVAAYERNDLAAAQEYLVSELSRLPKGDPWILNYTGFLLAMVREGQGRSHEACQIAESLSAQALQLRLPNQESLAHSFEAYIALRQGRLAQAVHWADKNDPGPIFPPYLWYNPHLTYAKVRLAQGREAWDASETFLARLREVYDSIHCTRALAEVLALEALLQEARGNGTPALQNLSEALRLAEPGGCVRLFVDLGPDMRDLLRKLGPGSSSLGFAGRILAAFAESSLGISGEIPSSPPVADSNPRRLLATELTHREMEVLTLLAERLSNKEIAARLDIGPATVKTHAATLYQKLNVSGRRQVVAKAEALGILPQSPR